jgi:hypothetical protein
MVWLLRWAGEEISAPKSIGNLVCELRSQKSLQIPIDRQRRAYHTSFSKLHCRTNIPSSMMV